MDELDRRSHPIAALFPLMSGDEFEQLKADISANGLLEDIWIHPDGSIIDGRNRHRACIETGMPPQFRTWAGNGSLVGFVVSMNLHRRHLTSSQRAVIALDVLPMLEDEAKERMRAGAEATNTGVERIPHPVEEQGKSRDQAAALFQTSGRYVGDAKKLQSEAPDLLEQIKDGEMTIPQAKRELTKRQHQDAPPLPDGKYRIWYADPPWKYNDSGIINNDNYGRAERHYPTMTISELCAMGDGIKDLCCPDAVLFLWTTSPFLEDAFEIVQAWGFKYKTSFVWDKVRHNFGHYNSVRHEFLLVCTRGSCTPDHLKLFDSVQEHERTSIHSEKPEQFRRIIETLYTEGDRIELFARDDHDGWATWGNE